MSHEDRPVQTISLECPKILLSPRWVRVKFGSSFIADSKRALLLREYSADTLPTYYFPQQDIDFSLIEEAENHPNKDNVRQYWTIDTGDKRAEGVVWSYRQPPLEYVELKDYFSFKWNAMDAWYEEEEEVFVHARDPFKRIDVIQSTRHVRVELEGKVLAESRTPFLLFETGLPIRFYLPAEHVNHDILVSSTSTSQCPYKGVAHYWSVNLGGQLIEDIVWTYPNPIPEMPKIRDLICFFNEKVDIFLDGQPQKRQLTKWT